MGRRTEKGAPPKTLLLCERFRKDPPCPQTSPLRKTSSTRTPRSALTQGGNTPDGNPAHTDIYILYASPARDIITNGTQQAEEAGSGRLATRPLRQDGQEVRPRAIPRRHATVSPLPPPLHHNLCTDATPSKTSTSSEASSRRSTRRQPGTAWAVWTSPPLRGSEAYSEDGHMRWKSSLRMAGS